MSGIFRGSIRIRWPRPGLADVAHRAGDRVGLELDADELRRREAPSDRDQPLAAAARDVEHAAAAAQGRRQVRQLRQALLEEHRDVLDRDRLDRPVEARRPLVDRPAGPEELRQPGVVQARHDRDDELAAEVLRVGVVEEDRRRRRPRAGRSVAVQLDQVAGVGRPEPGPDRLGPAAGAPAAEARSAMPGGTGFVDPARTARAPARGRSPSSGRSRRRGGELLEPILATHRRRIVASVDTPKMPNAAPAGTAFGVQGEGRVLRRAKLRVVDDVRLIVGARGAAAGGADLGWR